MRLFKWIGAATVALLATLILAGSAVAEPGVDACAAAGQKTSQGLCPQGLLLYLGQRGLDFPAFSLTSALSVECSSAELTGEILDSGETAESAYGQLEEFSAEGCSSSCGAVTLAAVNLPWKFEATNAKTETWKAVGFEYTTCGSTCKYEASELTAEVEGGEEATAAINKAVLKKVSGGLACPTTSTWSASAALLPKDYTYVALF